MSRASESIEIFLAGDVMTGRGIDQVLARPSDPHLHESFIRDARQYVALAEEVSGTIPRAVPPTHLWGVALDVLEQADPDARIINLETSITRCDTWSVEKGIHYRMHPENIAAVSAAGIHCCSLANNHVLDYGTSGLEETIDTLLAADILVAGAGRDLEQARAPASIDLGAKGRILMFALGEEASGIPYSWGATDARSGVNFISELTSETAAETIAMIAEHRRDGDLVIVSIHWGGNWGYTIPGDQRQFARRLIDSGLVDCIHGHSSHHAKGLEIYRDRPVFYGCGDFINDYEGISGQERFRGDLGLMYFPRFDTADWTLNELEIVPLIRQRFTLNYVSAADAKWLAQTLDRECRPFGTRVAVGRAGRLRATWRR